METILSRCQVLDFKGLPESVIAEALVSREKLDEKLAIKLAHQAQGNYNRALQLLHKDDSEFPFEEWFVQSGSCCVSSQRQCRRNFGLTSWERRNCRHRTGSPETVSAFLRGNVPIGFTAQLPIAFAGLY